MTSAREGTCNNTLTKKFREGTKSRVGLYQLMRQLQARNYISLRGAEADADVNGVGDSQLGAYLMPGHIQP